MPINNVVLCKCTQVLPDNMGVVRKALREMQPHVVACGPVGAEKPDEVC